MKISVKVPLIASTIIIVAFAVFSFFQYHSVRRALIQEVESSVNETSMALSHQIFNWLTGKLAMVEMMAETVSGDYGLTTLKRTIKTPVLRDKYILVYGAMASDGAFYSNSLNWEPPEGWDPRVRPWFQQAEAAGDGVVLTEPFLDVKTKEMICSTAAAFNRQGQFKGVIACDLSLKTVSQAVNTINFNHTGYAFLINAEGKIISHPDTAFNGKNMGALFSGGLPSLDGGLQEMRIGDAPVFVKFTPLASLGGKEWMIGVVLDKEKTLAVADNLKLWAIIGMLLAGLISSFILYLAMTRMLLTPINNLIVTADEISRGKLDFEIPETQRSDEVGLLAKAFERMGVSIRLAMTKLQQRN